jgi:hypothetical protein
MAFIFLYQGFSHGKFLHRAPGEQGRQAGRKNQLISPFRQSSGLTCPGPGAIFDGMKNATVCRQRIR